MDVAVVRMAGQVSYFRDEGCTYFEKCQRCPLSECIYVQGGVGPHGRHAPAEVDRLVEGHMAVALLAGDEDGAEQVIRERRASHRSGYSKWTVNWLRERFGHPEKAQDKGDAVQYLVDEGFASVDARIIVGVA